MSSKKITDADKLEIIDLYRQSGDTTASLASRYGVSNSTISRLLKTSIPEAEYEVLIQQKRGSKVGNDEGISTTALVEPNFAIPTAIPLEPKIDLDAIDHLNSLAPDPETASSTVSTLPADDRDAVIPSLPEIAIEQGSDLNSRRVRRRSSAPVATDDEPIEESVVTLELSDAATTPATDNIDLLLTELPPKTLVPPPIPRTPVLQKILSDSHDRYSNPPATPLVEDSIDELEDDTEPEDVNVLAAMFGEEIADGDDDEDDPDSEDWDEESTSTDRLLTADRSNVTVTPLSQATLPRTCYIAIDKFAELIVRPLKDFADLGQISGEQIQHRVLPVFDNHRVAKRFSNQRTQRVIKVPDSRIFYKTTQHLRSKGITCLLVDGNIYSLN
jgi:lambda repressor-like predicted transcriptional regulator